MTALANRFVGRKAELRALAELFASARQSHGDLLLVTGDAGMGKSRLVEHAVDAVRDTHTVLFGRSFEAGGAPTYLPWVQILRRIVRSADDSFLDEHRAARLVSVLPELRLRFPEMARLSVHDGDEARFALFDAVADVLLSAADVSPLVLVFEDVHVADPASLLFLELFADECRAASIAVVATARPGEADSKAAAERLKALGRKAHALSLSGLTRADVATYLAESLDTPVPDAVTDAVVAATEGHPLFVTEVAELLGAHGALELVAAGEAIAIPETVRDAIATRLDLLSTPTRALMQKAALIGRDFDVDRLSAMIGEERRSFLPQINEARGAGVITEVVPKTHRFAHVLIRDVLASELDPAEVTAHRVALVTALESRLDPPWEEIAHQLSKVSDAVDAPRVVRACRHAAEQATARIGFEDAVYFREAALAAIPAGDDAEEQRETLALAHALLRAGRSDEGRARCLEAAEMARSAGDGTGLAEAALVYGSVFKIADVDETLVSLLSEALPSLPSDADALRARVLARLAGALQPSPEPTGPIEMAREAIAMARRVDDPETLLATMRGAVSALMDLGDPAERSALNEEYVALAQGLGEPLEAFRGLRRLCFDCVELGDVTRMEQAVAMCTRIAEETGHPSVTWAAAAVRAMRASRAGDFELALEENARARSLAERAHDPNAERALSLQRFLVARALGFPDRERTPLDAVRRSFAGMRFGRRLVALVDGLLHTATGEVDDAWTAVSEDTIAAAFAMGDSSFLDCLADIAFDARDTKLGARIFEHATSKGLPAFASWGALGMSSGPPTEHLLALSTAAAERWDEANQLFTRAYDVARDADAWPSAVWAALRHAQMLLRRGRPEDRGRAEELAARAAGRAEELGMSFVAERARRLIESTPADATSPTDEASGSTGAAVPSATFTIVREGEGFRFEHEGRTFLLKDTKGVRLLEKLVAEPGRDHHVLDLSSPTGRRMASASGDAGAVIDDEARAAYAARLKDLRSELDEAETNNDGGRAERARAEISALTAELSRALGLGGRSRKAASASERARVNVQRRLKDAIRRVEAVDEPLARHLDWAIRTGTLCSYRPW